MRSFQTFFSISVIELKTDCSPLEIWCSINKCWLESKACFIQQASNLGRRALVQKPALKIVPDDEFLKGELFGDGIRTNNNTCLQNVFWLANGKVTVPCSRNLVLSLRLPSSTWAGTIAPIENAKVLSQRVGKTEQQNGADCFAYSLRRNQDTASQLQYCFLTVQPLFLHSLPSTLSNYLNLPFGMQGWSRKLNEAYVL